MMIKREGNGCSSVIQGSFAGLAKGMMTMSHLHSQHKESIGENMSPRSVLEHRALSGLAIAIDLEEEEKKNKSSHAEHHVVFVGRHCCKQNIQLMGTGREEQETDFDGGPDVGLRMVTSLYPLLNQSNSEANRGPLNLVMGRSLSPERVFMPEVAMSYGGERKQGDVCNRGMEVSLSSSLPLQTANIRGQLLTRKSTECRYDKESFLGGRSTEESIFYYENPSSSNALCTVVGDNDLSCSRMVNFLKVCALCKCRLGVGNDIYMYRGDQAFCSAECRDQRMMTDECMDL